MLNKNNIKRDIIEAMNSVKDKETDRDQAINTFADKLADSIINAIRSSTIEYITGLTSPSGPVTGIFQGNLK